MSGRTAESTTRSKRWLRGRRPRRALFRGVRRAGSRFLGRRRSIMIFQSHGKHDLLSDDPVWHALRGTSYPLPPRPRPGACTIRVTWRRSRPSPNRARSRLCHLRPGTASISSTVPSGSGACAGGWEEELSTFQQDGGNATAGSRHDASTIILTMPTSRRCSAVAAAQPGPFSEAYVFPRSLSRHPSGRAPACRGRRASRGGTCRTQHNLRPSRREGRGTLQPQALMQLAFADEEIPSSRAAGNIAAITLYKRLGFEIRRELVVSVAPAESERCEAFGLLCGRRDLTPIAAS